VKPVLFVVGGGTQWDDALRIAAHLPDGGHVLDLGPLRVVDAPPPGTPYPGAHWPEQGARRVAALVRLLERELANHGVMVLGQDAGRLQRVAARAARRHHVPYAVVPDGALFDLPASLPAREQLEELLLRWSRVTCGTPLRFGSTAPDLWCAWADGWIPMLRSFSPEGVTVVTGSPRAAAFALLPRPRARVERILLCSQPTWVHPFPPSTTAGPAWYRWLDEMVRTSEPGEVAVRLHPRERDIEAGLGLSDAVRSRATVGTSLLDDLRDVDAVVAPFSTVLMEAAAAGRKVVSVVPERACLAVRASSPAMADPELTVRTVDEVRDFASLRETIERHGVAETWGARYATVAGDTPARCAVAIGALAAA
jgi:hypothetical protein